MAYNNQTIVLRSIKLRQRAEAEFATFLLSLVLPSVVGGFVGAIVSGQGQKVVRQLAEHSSKYRWGMAFDVVKTVTSDMAKAEVRIVYQHLLDSGGWESSSISPTEFLSNVQGSIAEFVAAAADSLNASRLGRSPHKYRDVLSGLYYSSFIRDAPEISDLWSVSELAPALEVFLWVEWANRRDTKYWVDVISRVTEVHGSGFSERMKTFPDAAKVMELNPILERLDLLRVGRASISRRDPGPEQLSLLKHSVGQASCTSLPRDIAW